MVRGGAGHLDLNLVLDHAHGIAADFDSRVIRPDAVGQAKTPGVPRTRYDALFQITAAQGRAHVRTDVIDGKILSIYAEDGDQFVPDGNRLALAFRDVHYPANRSEFAHVLPA